MAASPGVRISGGLWRGRALMVAPGVRPTESRVREALLSIWQDRVPNARVLDLFAGSGAVGLEARSRGAASVLLVENDARAWRALTAACREWEAGARHPVQASHAVHAVQTWRGTLPGTLVDLARHGTAPFDLVFADPPYAWTEHARLLALLRPLLAPGAEIALEHSARTPLDSELPGFERASTRTYGGTALSFFTAAGARHGDETAAAGAAQGLGLENVTITESGTEATGVPPTRAGKKRQSRR